MKFHSKLFYSNFALLLSAAFAIVLMNGCSEDNPTCNYCDCEQCYDDPNSSSTKGDEKNTDKNDSNSRGNNSLIDGGHEPTESFEKNQGGLFSVNATSGSIYNSADGRTYNYVQRGALYIITDNMHYEPRYGTYCYGYNRDNCDKYGVLYGPYSDKEQLCPEGFSPPNRNQWKQVQNEKDLPFVYGGYCIMQDTLECFGLGETSIWGIGRENEPAKYETYTHKDGSVTIDTIMEANHIYTTVSCVKRKQIVDDASDLPTCSSETNDYWNFFVASEDTVYQCKDGQWIVEDSTEKYHMVPCEKGDTYIYKGNDKDILYACKKDLWRRAYPEDIGVSCTALREGQEYVINDRFVCHDLQWVKQMYPASELGECTDERRGEVRQTTNGEYYSCNSTGWKSPTIKEAYGQCNYAMQDSIVELSGHRYHCPTKTDGWQIDLDENWIFGFCTKSRNGEFAVDSSEGTLFKCSETGYWTKETDISKYIPCADSTYNRVLDFGYKKFQCNPYVKSWEEVSKLTLYNDEERTDSVVVECTYENLGKFYRVSQREVYLCNANYNSGYYIFSPNVTLGHRCHYGHENMIITTLDNVSMQCTKEKDLYYWRKPAEQETAE